MAIHNIKIYPGSSAETKFMRSLERVGVNPTMVMCRNGAVFGEDFDEYILSDGLYRLITEEA